MTKQSFETENHQENQIKKQTQFWATVSIFKFSSHCMAYFLIPFVLFRALASLSFSFLYCISLSDTCVFSMAITEELTLTYYMKFQV